MVRKIENSPIGRHTCSAAIHTHIHTHMALRVPLRPLNALDSPTRGRATQSATALRLEEINHYTR